MAMSTQYSSASPLFVDTGISAAEKCYWSNTDELAFINFLLECKAKAGDGSNFKANIWNAAAVEMLKHTAKGGMKVALKCKAKYVLVCQQLVYNLRGPLNIISFKRSIAQ